MLSKILLNIRHCGLGILRRSKRLSFKYICKSNFGKLVPKINIRWYNGTVLNIDIFSNLFSNDILSPVADNQSIINTKEDILPKGNTIIFLSFSHKNIRISLAWSKTKMRNTWPTVLPKIITARFTSIQITPNRGNFANILKSKFGTANDIVRFWWRRLKISILNIRCRNIQTIKCGIGECNTNTLLWNDSRKGRVFLVCSPVTILNPCRFLGDIHLRSKTICPLDFVIPIGAGLLPSRILNATATLDISLSIASFQKRIPLEASIRLARSTEVETSIPYLWVVRKTWALTAAIMRSSFLNVYGTHKQKAGSSEILWDWANQSISTGLCYFNNFRDTHF